MLTLVIGGAASGKSAYAEALVAALPGEKIYLATMRPWDAECIDRIARHQKARAEKGFCTLECFIGLAALEPPRGAALLLECVTNLLANELFDPNGAGAQAVEKILLGVERLCDRCSAVVAVSGAVFSDGCCYDPETTRYQRALGEINQRLAARADQVVELVCGIPVIHSKEGAGMCWNR